MKINNKILFVPSRFKDFSVFTSLRDYFEANKDDLKYESSAYYIFPFFLLEFISFLSYYSIKSDTNFDLAVDIMGYKNKVSRAFGTVLAFLYAVKIRRVFKYFEPSCVVISQQITMRNVIIELVAKSTGLNCFVLVDSVGGFVVTNSNSNHQYTSIPKLYEYYCSNGNSRNVDLETGSDSIKQLQYSIRNSRSYFELSSYKEIENILSSEYIVFVAENLSCYKNYIFSDFTPRDEKFHLDRASDIVDLVLAVSGVVNNSKLKFIIVSGYDNEISRGDIREIKEKFSSDLSSSSGSGSGSKTSFIEHFKDSNVIYIDSKDKDKTLGIIDKASVVVTVHSDFGLDALLLGKQVVTMRDVYYSGFNIAKVAEDTTELIRIIEKPYNYFGSSYTEDCVNFISFIMNVSAEKGHNGLATDISLLANKLIT